VARVQEPYCNQPHCEDESFSLDMCRRHYSKHLKGRGPKSCEHCSVPMNNLGRNQGQRKYCSTCSPVGDSEANQLLWKYQLSRPEYDAMYEDQLGLCAMPGCDREAKEVDHWHGCTEGHKNHRACSKCVRALLCRNCNNRLEPVEDEMFREAALAYLDQFENPGSGGGGMWS